MHEELVAWLAGLPPVEPSILRTLLMMVVKGMPRLKHRALRPALLGHLHSLAAQSTSQARLVLQLLQQPFGQRCHLHLTGETPQQWGLDLSALGDWLRLAETKVGMAPEQRTVLLPQHIINCAMPRMALSTWSCFGFWPRWL